MKIRFLYLNIFFAIVYSVLTFLSSSSITISDIFKVVMMSAAVIFVGYILDAKSTKKENKD